MVIAKCYVILPLVPPTTVTLSGQTTAIADVQSVVLNCTAGSSNPASIIYWQQNGTDFTNNALSSETGGEYNGRVTTYILTFVPTRKMDSMKYTCSANNAWGSRIYSKERQLDLTCKSIIVCVCSIIFNIYILIYKNYLRIGYIFSTNCNNITGYLL